MFWRTQTVSQNVLSIFCLILFKPLKKSAVFLLLFFVLFFQRQPPWAQCHKENLHENIPKGTQTTWLTIFLQTQHCRSLLQWRRSMLFCLFSLRGLIRSTSFCWSPSCMFMDLQDFNTRARNLLSQCRQLVSGCSRSCRLVTQWRSGWNLRWEKRTNIVSHIVRLQFVSQRVKWRVDDAQVIWRGITKRNNMLWCQMLTHKCVY